MQKYNIRIGMLKKRYLKRQKTMGRYRKERKPAVRRKKNTMRSQTI